MYEELITIISKKVNRELSEKCANCLLSCLGVTNRHAKYIVNLVHYQRIYKLGIYSPNRETALVASQQLLGELNKTSLAIIEASQQFAFFREHLIETGIMPRLGQVIPKLLSDYSPKNIPEERVAELSATLRQVGIWKYQLLALLNIPLFEKHTILKDLKEGERIFYAFDNLNYLSMQYETQLRDTFMGEESVSSSEFFEKMKGMDSFHRREVGGESGSNPGFLNTLGRIIQGIGGGFLLSADITVAITLTPLTGPVALGAVSTIGAGAGLVGYACRTSG